MRVLVAEDDRTTRFMVASLLAQWGYDVVAAENGSEAWQILQDDEAPPLAVIDWLMPGMEGPEICRRLRQSPEGRYRYVLLLTVQGDRASVVAGLDAGADDYVTKPFDAQELKMRVQAGRRILELQDRLRHQADHDGLTGLFNRGAVLTRLEKELSRSQRLKTPLAVAMADLDDFKKVNDRYGHLVGDIVLCDVARRMTETLRDYDEVGRYGGEEFLLVLPGVAGPEVGEILERVRSAVAAAPVLAGGWRLDVTVSLGGACFDGEEKLKGLVGRAAEALYRAKARGKNAVVLSC